ncbi:cyclophilin-like fold protein [Sinobaca sp. H24]|uniref:cyclophilin-like fold protein n=1 Tax=Sinobaca sp. H24 TaxID=2923376 RepID=UPI00207A18A3|nr:cyclophilin-like fold protein [Sinobaca sp. H24]
MKKSFSILCLFIFSLTACSMSDTNESNEMNQEELQPSDSIQETRDSDMVNPSTLIAITIDEQEFSARLYDNETTQAFIEILPLDINMSDVNSNEKFYRFQDTLPTNSERPGEIHAGDIMLYGDNGLVLFYESLSSDYSYTRIGYVEEAERFAQAVGDGDIRVSFDLNEVR